MAMAMASYANATHPSSNIGIGCCLLLDAICCVCGRWKYTDANIPAGVDRAVWQAVHEGYHLEFRSPDISRY